MPQIGNKKFPYTKEGIKRYEKIKKALGGKKPGYGIRPFPQNYRPHKSHKFKKGGM